MSELDWERKRRLAEVFGDVLPESTRDDRDEPGRDGVAEGSEGSGGSGGAGGAGGRGGVGDRWLREQVPPHHGS